MRRVDIIEKILNELKICNYAYGKKSGISKIFNNIGFESEELGKITTKPKSVVLKQMSKEEAVIYYNARFRKY